MAQITAALILIVSLLAVVGIFGDVATERTDILTLMIGSASTYLFLAQTKRNGTMIGRDRSDND